VYKKYKKESLNLSAYKNTNAMKKLLTLLNKLPKGTTVTITPHVGEGLTQHSSILLYHEESTTALRIPVTPDFEPTLIDMAFNVALFTQDVNTYYK
jgi:hypothetical protein